MILDVVRNRKLQFGKVVLNVKSQTNALFITKYVNALVDEGNTGIYNDICTHKIVAF